MKNLYIYHHLGLGDHIICNGIVRYYAEKYDKIFLFVKPRNITNVKYLFRDNPNIKFLALDDADVKTFMSFNKSNEYLIVGITPEWFRNLDILKKYETFDHGFYVAANVPMEDKWNKFYFERDLEKEKDAFYNKIGLKDNEEFIFVHDNPEQGRQFRSSTIPNDIKVINPGKYLNVGLFDFIYTMENAKQIHVMNSSFMNLIDCMQLKTGELFLHSYARTDMGDNPNPKLKLNWTILK